MDFVSRQHVVACRARYCRTNAVCLSNAGNVSKDCTYRQTFPTVTLVSEAHRHYKIPKGTLSAGSLSTHGRKNLLFSTKMAVYLGNGTRQAIVTMEH